MKMHLIFLISVTTALTILKTSAAYASGLIQPIPEKINVNASKAKLGKELFFDPRLSKDGTISCANCHQLANGGDDNLPVSIGIKGQHGTRNAPTVFNAVFNRYQFWDGRAKNLQEQVVVPIENPLEMGNKLTNLVKTLQKTNYQEKFKKIYQDGITTDNLLNAIAEYEKTLITPNAPFDRFLNGDKTAITQKQKAGYELFKSKGCIACHNGMNIGGNSFNTFGIFTKSTSPDLGRYHITNKEQDKHRFKVPSLRNVAKTAPYFHDGRTYELAEAVRTMAKYQLGRKITDDEVNKIVAFLESLSGELPKKSLK